MALCKLSEALIILWVSERTHECTTYIHKDYLHQRRIPKFCKYWEEGL